MNNIPGKCRRNRWSASLQMLPIKRGKSVKALVWVAVLCGIASFAAATPASAQLVTIQQVSTGRYLDAWENSSNDYRAVVWSQQENDSQL